MSEADEIETRGVPFPRIVSVAPGDAYHLRVTHADRSETDVDLGPTIHALKIYAPLRDDRALFESVHVVNPSVIAWGGDDAIDMHVALIERLAGEAAAPPRTERARLGNLNHR